MEIVKGHQRLAILGVQTWAMVVAKEELSEKGREAFGLMTASFNDLVKTIEGECNRA